MIRAKNSYHSGYVIIFVQNEANKLQMNDFFLNLFAGPNTVRIQ